MRRHLYAATKAYIRAELLRARNILNLTQEEMACRMEMSTRAYVALEGGKSCCGLLTFLFFLCRCCPDTQAFLSGLLALFKNPDAR